MATNGRSKLRTYNGITIKAANDSIQENLDSIVCSEKFQKWIDDIDREAIELKEFTVTDVDFFGPAAPSRLGFVKGVGIAFDRISGDRIPAIAFIRGASVAVLIVVTVFETNQKFVLLCKQLRFPAGRALVEACAGMLDNETRNVTGVVFKEIQEETGFVINEDDLIELGTVRPSGGGCDEQIHLFAWETTISEQDFTLKQKQVFGEGIHEKIKLQFYDFSTFDETLDALGDVKAECCWRRYLRYLKKTARTAGTCKECVDLSRDLLSSPPNILQFASWMESMYRGMFLRTVDWKSCCDSWSRRLFERIIPAIALDFVATCIVLKTCSWIRTMSV